MSGQKHLTVEDLQLLEEISYGRISWQTLLDTFSIDIRNDKETTAAVVGELIQKGDSESTEHALTLIWLSENIRQYVDVLNELLLSDSHQSHQVIAKNLQDFAPDPSSICYIRRALEMNFRHISYAAIDLGAVVKWFSWLLYTIGTPEAIQLMKDYAQSPDREIADEMVYRLSKSNR